MLAAGMGGGYGIFDARELVSRLPVDRLASPRFVAVASRPLALRCTSSSAASAKPATPAAWLLALLAHRSLSSCDRLFCARDLHLRRRLCSCVSHVREEVNILSSFPTRAMLNIHLLAPCDDAANNQLQPGVGSFKCCFWRSVQRCLRVRERAVRQMVLPSRTGAGSVRDRVFWKAVYSKAALDAPSEGRCCPILKRASEKLRMVTNGYKWLQMVTRT